MRSQFICSWKRSLPPVRKKAEVWIQFGRSELEEGSYATWQQFRNPKLYNALRFTFFCDFISSYLSNLVILANGSIEQSHWTDGNRYVKVVIVMAILARVGMTSIVTCAHTILEAWCVRLPNLVCHLIWYAAKCFQQCGDWPWGRSWWQSWQSICE